MDKSLSIGFILPKPIEYDLSNGQGCLLFEQLWPDGQGPRLFFSPIPVFRVCRTGVTKSKLACEGKLSAFSVECAAKSLECALQKKIKT